MTQIIGGIWMPALIPFNTGVPAFKTGGKLIDATGEKMAWVFRAPKSGTLDTCEMLVTSDIQFPGSNGIKFSFQSVDPATGFPDETVDQFRTLTTGLDANTWVVPGLMTSDGTDGGVKRTVVKDEVFAFVMEFASFQASSTFRCALLDARPLSAPYFVHKTAGAWAKDNLSTPVLGLKYDDGTYPYLQGFCQPIKTFTTDVINTGTTPDEVGMHFHFPCDVLIGGALVRVDMDGDMQVNVYDSQGVLMGSSTLDKDVRGGTAMAPELALFNNFVAKANERYTIWVKPTTATSVTVGSYTVNSSDMLKIVDASGPWGYLSRVDAGAETEVATKRPFFNLLVTGIDFEVGGQPSAGSMGDS